MYSINEIKELITLLEDSSLSVLEVMKEDGSKVRLEKPQQCVTSQVSGNFSPVAVLPTQQEVKPVETLAQPQATDNCKTINSPIVGVFYAAPSPESAPYVSVGKKVSKGNTICIVEAMKCMNEIAAEFDCEIVEILVNDGDLVEYGQPLFKVK